MTQSANLQHSTGKYSHNATQFSMPQRRIMVRRSGSGGGLRPVDTSFIVPMMNNTGTLITEWYLGGMTSPKCIDFGISKNDWNTKVVCPLEEHIPEKYTGRAVFHFNDGHILKKEVMKK